jgi:riboflavin kinase / FMN adenylyltransferase
MKVLRLQALAPVQLDAPAVTLGNFDGVHRGHQALLAATRARARERDAKAVVLTFDPHPARVLNPAHAPKSLSTVEQKKEILTALGADVLAVLPFTGEVAGWSPAAFAEGVLARTLGAREVIVGEGFRFGHGRTGDVRELERIGRRLGFEVVSMEPVLHDGTPVSSTRVREALAQGDVGAAQDLLGRPYSVDGRVVRGDGRGQKLGIPTANLEPENEILPRPGVYAARAVVDGSAPATYSAVVNLGRRPTFGGRETVLEAHLLDFAGDLYGRRLRLGFVSRLRDEKTFASVEALLAQIKEDVAAAAVALAKAGGARRAGL